MMSFSTLLLFSSPVLVYTLCNAYCLFHNYRIARKIGISVIILPASPDNPLWMLTSDFILAIIRSIFGESDVTTYGRLGWEYHDKSAVHQQRGDAIVLVTPGYNWIYLCNAEAVNDIFRRRNDFDRPTEMLAFLDVFGPNISTAHGADWQRQRKITSAPFNEQNNKVVWAESLRQADEMLHFWKDQPSPMRRTSKDTRTFSLHVLSGAGFGRSYSFQKSAELPKPGHMFNYRDSLALILKNSLLIVILGPKFLANGFLPQSLARLGQACVDFKYYMTEMVNEEKESIAQGNDGGANITNSLIRASQEVSQSAGTKETKAFSGLTEQEIYGNIFVYNFAGHDTTALTLCTAINLLAAFPDVQDWMAEEINVALEDDDPSTWNYPEVYPKLNRCLAVLLETVRLWNPLIGIAKCTTINPQPLTMNGHDITIPPNTRIIPNINAIHAHPKYWGTDSLAWRPNRWIKSQPGATTQLDREYLHTPSKGSYVPWSDGARACPGKKFGQAEFVGAMVSLFRKHRVEVVPENGESVEEAQSRALNAVKDSRIVLLLQMRDPESVGLRWVEK